MIFRMGEGFRWNDWNLQHATRHGCTVQEIEAVVRREVRNRRMKAMGGGKNYVEGRGIGNRLIAVIFIFDRVKQAEEETIYVIHAMPLITRRRRGR